MMADREEAEIEAAYRAEIERCNKLRNLFPRAEADRAIIAGWTIEQAMKQLHQKDNN